MAVLRSQTSIKFHSFPRLPSELRLKIWRLSLQPRIIDIRLREVTRPSGKPLPSPPPELILPAPYKSPFPTAFHVCRESRNEALSTYHPFSGTTFSPAAGTLINLELDTVYCPDELFNVVDQIMPKTVVGPDYYFPDRSVLFRLAMDEAFAENVTSLAISAIGLKAMGTMTENMIPVLRRYRNLRELFLVGGRESGGQVIEGTQDWRGEPRLLPGRPCPDGECTFWLYMFAGLVPVDVMSWQVRLVEDLRYELMDEGFEGDWKPPKFKFMESRRYRNWESHEHELNNWVYCSCKKHARGNGLHDPPRRPWTE